MRKVLKAKSLGYNCLTERHICLLYYLWAKCDATSYCSLVDSGTCYAHPDYLTAAMNLYADRLLEIDDKDASYYRLSKRGRALVLKLGM